MKKYILLLVLTFVYSQPEIILVPPVAYDGEYTLEEDTQINIYLSASDEDGDLLTFSIVTQSSNGIVELDGSVVTYSPDMNFNGVDSFTFIANDGMNDSNIATISLTVIPINDAPYLENIPDATIQENTQFSYWINAYDVDGDALTFAATINGDAYIYMDNNELTVIPDEDFIGILVVLLQYLMALQQIPLILQ